MSEPKMTIDLPFSPEDVRLGRVKHTEPDFQHELAAAKARIAELEAHLATICAETIEECAQVCQAEVAGWQEEINHHLGYSDYDDEYRTVDQLCLATAQACLDGIRTLNKPPLESPDANLYRW